ncbi:hypothetical protein K469DRAFT_326820 [Zopfia rhizophila CBS 207.26]|uniref:Uncharacterized protein n=1 Tax=Zopfia rhizophila CBS 207.26 TaxID=1314779 RepID=A0A6A6DM59_9PEZI|nr:hypothetical protein K469DRAFT_326820 [Zopfia rhizophila CBS 207.26]
MKTLAQGFLVKDKQSRGRRCFFLIGPMWLLVLKCELFFLLGATTVCVTGFGFLMACYVDGLKYVFVRTLAYAAVLMVFVGVIMQELGNSTKDSGTATSCRG